MVISSEGKVCKTGPGPTSAIRNPRWKHSSTSLSPAFERNRRRTKLAQDRGTDRVCSMQPSSSLDTCAWLFKGFFWLVITIVALMAPAFAYGPGGGSWNIWVRFYFVHLFLFVLSTGLRRQAALVARSR